MTRDKSVAGGVLSVVQGKVVIREGKPFVTVTSAVYLSLRTLELTFAQFAVKRCNSQIVHSLGPTFLAAC